MRIVIAGGSGLLGRRLAAALAAAGHDIVILSRRSAGQGATPRVRFAPWAPDGTAPSRAGADRGWAREVNDADAIVNLAGEGIADRRWSPARKLALQESRVTSTRSLVAAIRASEPKPRVLLSGSAVGYYGDTGDDTVDESHQPGSDFLARLCVAWEAEARAAESSCRVAIMRTGIVLTRDGGALKKLIPPFLLFGGGPIASGRQWMSWIHVDDWVAMMRWAIETPGVAGPLDGTAPHPARNRDFSRALGRALHRPSWLPVPAFALEIIVGEMAGVALVAGQRVLPTRPLELGFTFRYPELDAAMTAAIRGSR